MAERLDMGRGIYHTYPVLVIIVIMVVNLFFYFEYENRYRFLFFVVWFYNNINTVYLCPQSTMSDGSKSIIIKRKE